MNKYFDPKNKRSRDLTLVLLHSNGIPRSFRIQIPELRKHVFFLSILFFASLIGMIVFGTLYFQNPKSSSISRPQTTERVEAPPIKVTPTATNTAIEPEFQSAASYKEELNKVQYELEQRKKLNIMDSSKSINIPISLLSRQSEMASDKDAVVKIQNPIVKRNNANKSLTLQFDIRNSTEGAVNSRGYIVVLAKSPSTIYAYPPNAFSTNENIMINFAKGETFAVSRFRQAFAEFKNINETNPLHFQIFLFATDGKVLHTQHFEEGK